jgi:hemerythrin-like metal-binding protein
MAFEFWNDEHNIDNAEIDRQHKHVMALVNALEVAVTSGDGAATTDLVFAHLQRYLAKHFLTEDRLMEAAGYPDLPAHREQHEACMRRLSEIASAVAAGSQITDSVAEIQDWLHGHLLGSDHRYAEWVRSHPEPVELCAREIAAQLDTPPGKWGGVSRRGGLARPPAPASSS